jgi:hypothetical protein
VTAAVGTGDTVCGAIKSVAMTLRLTAAETEALRRKVAAQQRSMQHVARDEICSYISSTERVAEVAAQVVKEDQGLLRRLAES